MFNPARDVFEELYHQGKAQLVWTQIVADLETPVSAMLKLTKGQKYSFLFESVEGGAVRGRYSMIGYQPDLLFKIEGQKAYLKNMLDKDAPFHELEDKPLNALRKLNEKHYFEMPEGLPSMATGLFGYLGYDSVRLMEHLPDENPDDIGVADSLLIRPTMTAIFDAVKDALYILTPVHLEEGVSASQAYNRACARIDDALALLDQPVEKASEIQKITPPNQKSNTTKQEYLKMVEKAKDYIGAGDIFQVVLSQRFEAPFTLPPFALYRALRRINPSPYLYYLNFDDYSIVGSSPEILVRARNGEVTIRPIAGTRPRGKNVAEDKALADELLADPKECAEHLMLLDLGRNDVGRVSKIGSVQVTDKFGLEYYSQVMHIVSNVIGALDEERFDAIDALCAGFPAGTVSGAPKVRAMQIIDELEKNKRGIYAGCVGYFGANGDMDSCIVLRTAIIKDQKMYVQAGAGIVADSVPLSEYEECQNKAKALFKAAEEAVRFASFGQKGQ